MDSDASARDSKLHVRTLKQKQARKTTLNLYELSEQTENNNNKVKESSLSTYVILTADPWGGKRESEHWKFLS